MSPRKKKRSPRPKRQSTPLSDHRKVGRRLEPPLVAGLPVAFSHWERDMLPETLWMDAVADHLGWNRTPGAIHSALDVIDQFVEPDRKETEVLSGLISSFCVVADERRPAARAALRASGMDDSAIPEVFRHALGLYADCPAAWLIEDWRKTNRVDPEIGLPYLKAAVLRLLDSRGVHATRCRMLALARLMKHRKLLFPRDFDSAELLTKYPSGLSEDDQRRVESFVRATFLAVGGLALQSTDWAPYFWRHNYRISACQPVGHTAIDAQDLPTEDWEGMMRQILQAASRLRSVIDRLAMQAPLDIYEMNKDEVLFGLLSRQFRLFTAMALDIRLWAPDLGTMILRPMADALITLKWLISRNDPALFERFKTFSAGKRKLFKLHIEKFADGAGLDLAEVESYLSESVNEEIWEELLPIDVGANFAGLTARQMALEADLEPLYNLVFSPSSGGVHGDWMSLKEFALQRCGNPLHRFHRLPRLVSLQVLDPGSVAQASVILAATFVAWADSYGLEIPEDAADEFVQGVRGALEATHPPPTGGEPGT